VARKKSHEDTMTQRFHEEKQLKKSLKAPNPPRLQRGVSCQSFATIIISYNVIRSTKGNDAGIKGRKDITMGSSLDLIIKRKSK